MLWTDCSWMMRDALLQRGHRRSLKSLDWKGPASSLQRHQSQQCILLNLNWSILRDAYYCKLLDLTLFTTLELTLWPSALKWSVSFQRINFNVVSCCVKNKRIIVRFRKNFKNGQWRAVHSVMGSVVCYSCYITTAICATSGVYSQRLYKEIEKQTKTESTVCLCWPKSFICFFWLHVSLGILPFGSKIIQTRK